MIKALIDPKGEAFAYVEGNVLYTLDGHPSGQLVNGFVIDLAGHPVWRIFGDGVYSLDGFQPIGYFGAEMPAFYRN